jgi:hypothetical protein
MRALDQFWKFYASFADGVAHTRRSTEHDERYAHSPDHQRAAKPEPAAGDDENHARQGGSYPAVWPR